MCQKKRRPFVRSWVGILFGLIAHAAALGAASDFSTQPLSDVVAVGRGKGKFVLATIAAPADRLQWRFRQIPFSSSNVAVEDVELSLGGTKALVILKGDQPRVLDLTERVSEVGVDRAVSQHRLPDQLFAYSIRPDAALGKTCLLDDLGQSGKRPCSDAAAAAVHEDGRVLYAYEGGLLAVVSPDGNREWLEYHVPEGANFKLLAGQRGDAHDFLILIDTIGQSQSQSVAQSGRALSSVTSPVSASIKTEIIDPRRPDAPLGKFADPLVAWLRAMLEFAPLPTEENARVSDKTLTTLVAHLKEEAGSDELAWSFSRVKANVELYAPVLEFADKEPDYPSDVEIWKTILPLSHGTSREDYQTAYASLGDQRWSRCTSYVRTLSYPGTWLVEYWYYYPFDEGKSHPHLHDSEHFFVEVDKLGGTVRSIFAADHDSFVANNLYSTLVTNAPPVTLPLFATVELGKHAMAPDLNHDGRFDRGIDDNLHREPYSVWGLRDRSSKVHFMMEPYLAYMSLPRRRDGRFALADDRLLFPQLDVPADHFACTTQPFPADPPCPHCNAATSEAGAAQLVEHQDARNPEAIYKTYVAPWREMRVGVGLYDWSETRGELSLGMAGDFRHMSAGLLRIPAQLNLEFGWKPLGSYIPIPLGGETRFVSSKSTLFAGAGLEHLVTNTQGFYFEATPKWVNISETVIDGTVSPSNPHWQYGGVSYHTGYVLELPSAHKGTLINYLGVVIRNSPQYPVLFEWRVGLGFLRRRGRHDFGARVSDRNPYE